MLGGSTAVPGLLAPGTAYRDDVWAYTLATNSWQELLSPSAASVTLSPIP